MDWDVGYRSSDSLIFFFYLAFRWVIFFFQLEESISMLNTPKSKTSQPINCPIAQSISQPNN